MLEKRDLEANADVTVPGDSKVTRAVLEKVDFLVSQDEMA